MATESTGVSEGLYNSSEIQTLMHLGDILAGLSSASKSNTHFQYALNRAVDFFSANDINCTLHQCRTRIAFLLTHCITSLPPQLAQALHLLHKIPRHSDHSYTSTQNILNHIHHLSVIAQRLIEEITLVKATSPRIKLEHEWMVKRHLKEVMTIEQELQKPHMWDEEDFETQLKGKYNSGIVAKENERITGFMVFETWPAALHLLKFVVSKAYRKKSTGLEMAFRLHTDILKSDKDNITINIDSETLPDVPSLTGYGFRFQMRNKHDMPSRPLIMELRRKTSTPHPLDNPKIWLQQADIFLEIENVLSLKEAA